MKKDSLKLILTRLKPYRDMAGDFLLMLGEIEDEDKELVNKLYELIVHNIKEIKSKDQLQKISYELRKIREKEMLEDIKDRQDLDKLELLIDNID